MREIPTSLKQIASANLWHSFATLASVLNKESQWRLMVALLYPKHAFIRSHDDPRERWSENVVWMRRPLLAGAR